MMDFYLKDNSFLLSQNSQKRRQTQKEPQYLKKIILRTNEKTIERLAPGCLGLFLISGQYPKITLAKQSIAAYKSRQGDSLGFLVTLRGSKKNQFLQVLKDVVLPKLGDFEGFSRSGLDNQGNFSFGLESFILWPQCAPYYGIFQDFGGFHVTLVTESPLSQEESCVLYTKLGLPIR